MKRGENCTYSPKEFAAALEEKAGVKRSERWVQDHAKSGDIKKLPIPGRIVIPASELRRLISTAA